MRKLLILATLFFATALLSDELAWVDQQVEAIKPPRSGANTQLLVSAHTPFVFLKKEEKKEGKKVFASKLPTSTTGSKVTAPKPKAQKLTLWLIVNKSAKINDSWYKQGDSVAGYKIENIDSKSVLLKKRKKTLLLSTRSSSSKLKFNNK